VTEAVRQNHFHRGSFCDARSMLLRIDPSRPFTKDYQTVKFIGQGSFGSIFEVKQKRSGEIRVSKEILMRDIEDKQYAQVELEAMVRLDHPNVLKLYEYFEDNAAVYLICEMVAGGDFSQLGDPNIPLDEIRLLFRDVVAALAYCHNQNVAHRDLKMENCLICIKGTRKVGKVIDFGLAGIKRDHDNGQWMNEILGTRYYVAPEIIDKRIRYGFGCDVWAVGVMLYITVADEHPCAAHGFKLKTQELWRRIVSKDPIRLQPLKNARVSACLKSLLLGTAEKKVEPGGFSFYTQKDNARNNSTYGLLEKVFGKRPTAQKVLEHEWFQRLTTGESTNTLRRPSTVSNSSLSNVVRGKSESSLDFNQRGSRQSERSEDAVETVETVVKRACTYQQASNFERAILTIAAYQEQSQEIESLKSIFMELDTSRDGTLCKKELDVGLKGAGVTMSSQELNRLFAALDADGTGKIHWTEWLAATIQPSEIASDQAVDNVFDFLDVERTHTRVHLRELEQVLGDEASAASLLRAADVQGRSFITKSDLKRVMKEVAKSMALSQSRCSVGTALTAPSNSSGLTYLSFGR